MCFCRLFNNGFNYKIANLFPKVNLPVSRGTRGISSLIKWNNGGDSPVPILDNIATSNIDSADLKKRSFREIAMSILGIEDSKTIPLTASLNDLGITSGNAVELKNVLAIAFNLKLSVEEIRQISLQELDSFQK